MVLALLVAAPAASAGTRQDIISDCYDDGKLDGNYTPSQIRDARNNLPADIDQYSDCRDVLARALGGSGDKAVGGGSGGGGGGGGSALGGGGLGDGAAAEPLTASGPEEQQALDAAALSGGDKPIQVGDSTIRPARRVRRRRRAQRPAPEPPRGPDPPRPRGRRRRGPARPQACPRSPARLTRPRCGRSGPRRCRPSSRPRPPARRRRRRSPAASRSCSPASAFVADGGLRLERTTYVEVALMLLGAVLCAAALLVPRARVRAPARRARRSPAVALLAAYTALSIIWSLAPSDSWIEANRTFSYLAAFAGTMALARLAPGRWAAVLHGIALACVVVSGWALLTKVFPGALAEDEIYARLRAPFDYWNSVGLTAALGILALLWLGARRTGRGVVNALAWPGIALLEVALMLSYSRGALLALAVGLVVLVRRDAAAPARRDRAARRDGGRRAGDRAGRSR